MSDIKKIPLKDLKLGMYVTEIEGKKKGMKVKAGGRVRAQELIEKMKSQKIKFVYVDFELDEPSQRGEQSSKIEPKIIQKDEVKELPTEQPATKTPLKSQIKKTSMEQEINRAEVLFDEAKALQEKLFDSAMKDEQIDLDVLEDATSNIISSIFRNPDALLFMTRLKNIDNYLFEHAINSNILMTAFASYLEYEEGLIHEMAIGSFMHDIGKILIPKAVLNKEEKLNDKEYAQMLKHVDYSKKILEGIPGISPVSIDIVAVHHERLDGSGYPDGLKGDDVPTWGRMIAIVDTYDAITAERRYQTAKTSVDAFRVLMASPEKYDNELVQQFIKCVGVYPIGSIVKLKSGKLCMVYRANENEPLKPIVVSFYNVNQRHYSEVRKLDLSKSNEEIEMNVKSEDFDIPLNRDLLQSLFSGV